MFDLIFTVENTKKTCETIQVTEMMKTHEVHPLSGFAERYINIKECAGFVTRMGVGCKLPTCTHKLDRIPVIFLI